jgi:hypothetical protein
MHDVPVTYLVHCNKKAEKTCLQFKYLKHGKYRKKNIYISHFEDAIDFLLGI